MTLTNDKQPIMEQTTHQFKLALFTKLKWQQQSTDPAIHRHAQKRYLGTRKRAEDVLNAVRKLKMTSKVDD